MKERVVKIWSCHVCIGGGMGISTIFENCQV
nr:hypothetical protein [Lentibacillus sp. CBA3610]